MATEDRWSMLFVMVPFALLTVWLHALICKRFGDRFGMGFVFVAIVLTVCVVRVLFK